MPLVNDFHCLEEDLILKLHEILILSDVLFLQPTWRENVTQVTDERHTAHGWCSAIVQVNDNKKEYATFIIYIKIYRTRIRPDQAPSKVNFW